MKRIFWLVFIILLSITIKADLRVYSTQGLVEIKREGTWVQVFQGDELFETDSLRTEENGNVVLGDRTKSIPYSIQSPQVRLVKDLIRENKPHTIALSEEFMRGAYNFLLGRTTKEIVGEPGTSSKGEDIDIAVASALKNKKGSSYLVELKLLDPSTMKPVSQVYENQPVIAQVSNHSNTSLYINILDKDANGQLSALFSYAYDTIFHLYIPAYSTITLSGYGYQFSLFPANTTDQLTLVAYQKPFNLERVLSLLLEETVRQTTNTINEPIGIYQMNVPIISAGSY